MATSSQKRSDPSVLLARVSTVDALEEAIRRQVLNGEIAAGSQLREMDLVTRYNVGRNSIRAALQGLVQSGLLRHELNRGVFVPRLSTGDVEDLYLVRSAIESEAVAAVVARSSDLGELRALVGELQDLGPDADWMTAVELDLQLHTTLVAAPGSPRMLRTYSELLAEQRLLLAQVRDSYPQPAVLGEIHSVIVEALAAGDADRATLAVRAHLDEGCAEVIRAMTGAAPAEPAADDA